MTYPGRAFCTLVAVAAIALPSARAWSAQREGSEDRKPSLSLRATPPVGFSPLRVRVVVDVRGGADDYADFYCPTVEWDWGDGTVSEASADCDPYEAGKSTIQRRWSSEHVFRQAGGFKIVFRLKQRNKAVAVSSAQVQVRAGMREGFGGL
ncbi:MAG TPA: hypothetical protein VIX63_18510 [Vicinamibacterales bacterium]